MRAEFVVRATEYGSVTELDSTFPVDGANTSTDQRYSSPAATPSTDQVPLASLRTAATRSGSPIAPASQRSSATSRAVGAHRVRVASSPFQSVPSGADATASA